MAHKMNQALTPGTVLKGKEFTYTIRKVLGQGAFGITYLATTCMKGRLGEVTVPVALKEFFAKELDTRMDDGSVSARSLDGLAQKYASAFKQESVKLSRMKHPGIVNVLEAFDAKGTCYYSMEYFSGGNLDDKVKGRGIPEAEALRLTRKIGDALASIHNARMVHLDLKPKNIMLKDDGSPVIIDFGLSKQYDEKGEPESSSSIGSGTPGYAPIEQANQTGVRGFQPTLDIYALGATLFKMLTGVTPPPAPDILNEGFPEESLLKNSVSRGTIDAIRAAMSATRNTRPQSVTEFLSMLPGLSVPEEGETVEERTRKDRVSEPKGSRRFRRTWLWLLIAVSVFALLGWFFFNNHGGSGGNDGRPDVVDTLEQMSLTPAEVDPGEVIKPELDLTGSLNVSSDPPGAIIWLDEKNSGKQTPGVLENVPSGEHIVSLTLKGYSSVKVSVLVPPGQSTSLKCILSAIQTTAVSVAEPPSERITSGSRESQQVSSAGTSPENGKLNGHEYVDLGLSVKWATMNVGASSPEGYGGYFAWGEIATKKEYLWTTLKYCMDGSGVVFSKYAARTSSQPENDNKTRLDRSDDAARLNWGSGWRMPTLVEFTELCTRCTWTWTSINGKSGYKVTSRTTGNSIFLPAAGARGGAGLEDAGSYGFYWSSSRHSDNPANAYYLLFDSSVVNRYTRYRYYGHSIRAVVDNSFADIAI